MFIANLSENFKDNSVEKFLSLVKRCCHVKRIIMPIEFPADHPVEQFGRLFLACLLKHHELGKLGKYFLCFFYFLACFFLLGPEYSVFRNCRTAECCSCERY